MRMIIAGLIGAVCFVELAATEAKAASCRCPTTAEVYSSSCCQSKGGDSVGGGGSSGSKSGGASSGTSPDKGSGSKGKDAAPSSDKSK